MSERRESFRGISVEVRDKRHLLESLDLYVKGELLEGDNAYMCSVCDAKTDAIRVSRISKLPPTLVVHLKRFSFDYERMDRLKLRHRFEFPLELEMKPYLDESAPEDGCSDAER